MAITWRNIDAPDFSQVAQMQQLAAENMVSGIDRLKGMADKEVATQKENATFGLVDELRRNVTDLDSFNQVDIGALAEKYKGADKTAALEAVLKWRPDMVQQTANDKAADKELRLAASKIGLEDLKIQADDAKAKIGSVDEAFTQAQSITDWTQINDTWRARLKDVEDTISGSGGKGFWFGKGDFDKQLTEKMNSFKKQGGTPAMFEYVMSQLERDTNGAINMGDFDSTYKALKPLYEAEKLKQAELRLLDSNLNKSILDHQKKQYDVLKQIHGR